MTKLMWFPDYSFRTWLVRKLVRFAVRLDPATPFVQQADEHWQLNRRWNQPNGGGYVAGSEEGSR